MRKQETIKEYEDVLFDLTEKISRRDNLHWDRNRGLIFKRARLKLKEIDEKSRNNRTLI
jgi:hypothetical protein